MLMSQVRYTGQVGPNREWLRHTLQDCVGRELGQTVDKGLQYSDWSGSKRSRVEGDDCIVTPGQRPRCLAVRLLADTSVDVSSASYLMTRTYASVADRSR